MQRRTIQTSKSRLHVASGSWRMLCLAVFLGLTLGLTACGDDEPAPEEVETPVVEDGQTPAGEEGEAAIETDIVGDENVQQKDRPDMDADKVPTEPAAEGQAPAPESMPTEDEGPPAEQPKSSNKPSNKPPEKPGDATETPIPPEGDKGSSEKRVSPEDLNPDTEEINP